MKLRLSQAADVRLGRQRAPKYEDGDSMVLYLRSANVVDGALDLSDVKQMDFSAEEQKVFGLEPGDVLVTEGSGSREAVGVSAVWHGELDGRVCFQNTLLRLRPRRGVTDGPFLSWWVRHARSSGQIAAACSGANIQHLGSEGLKGLSVLVPQVDEQRRIADFLDDRVGRIDRIIVARGDQQSALSDWFAGRWARQSRDLAGRFGLVPLRRFLVSIADGPFGSALTSNHYSDGGTRVIRLGNIGAGEFRNTDQAFIPDDYAVELASHEAKPGDLVMAGLGDDRWPLGRCSVIPEEVGPAIVKADCYRIRLDPRISHSFAAAYLSSPPSRASIALLSRGATRARLNTDVARAVELPPAPKTDQERYVAAVQGEAQAFKKSMAVTARSIDLLAEYKQSLITAAVTGELDVTTAGSGIPA